MTRRLFALAGLLAVLVLSACSGNNESEVTSDPSWIGGAPLSVKSQTQLAELVESPEEFVGKTIRLAGKVTGVCKGSGCWVELTDETGHCFIAKSVDHSISFPRDCEGKQAIVEGLIISQPAPAPAEPEHEHQEGEEPHECPAPMYMMDMKAAELI